MGLTTVEFSGLHISESGKRLHVTGGALRVDCSKPRTLHSRTLLMCNLPVIEEILVSEINLRNFTVNTL